MIEGVSDTPDELNEAAAITARGLRRSALTPIWIACLALCLDVPVFAVALWFAQYAVLPAAGFSPAGAALAGIVAATVAGLGLAFTKGYAPKSLRRPGRALGHTALALILPVTGMALALPVAPAGFLLVAALALALAAIPLRLGGAAVAGWILETRLLDRRAVIAGGGDNAERLIRGLAAQTETDIQVHGLFDDRDDARSPIQVLGVPKLGGYTELISFVRASEIDMVIISLPLEAQERVDWLLEAFKILPVEVRLSAFSQDYAFPQPDRDPLISAIRRSFTPERRLTKRAFDILFASVALIATAPAMLAAALAVRLDSSGPVFFRQKRHGYNDRIIEVLKFRSLFHTASDPAARQIVGRGDPRVTRVGRFLRRSSIDELPQLFNVLTGDLSLVGPRPHAIDAVSSDRERFTRIVKGYSARHRLPPGITGWAQINGWRGEIDDPDKLRARFAHDLYYIENWSIWLDLKILLRTPLSLLGSNAY